MNPTILFVGEQRLSIVLLFVEYHSKIIKIDLESLKIFDSHYAILIEVN